MPPAVVGANWHEATPAVEIGALQDAFGVDVVSVIVTVPVGTVRPESEIDPARETVA